MKKILLLVSTVTLLMTGCGEIDQNSADALALKALSSLAIKYGEAGIQCQAAVLLAVNDAQANNTLAALDLNRLFAQPGCAELDAAAQQGFMKVISLINSVMAQNGVAG